ncbi:DUF389 domain-containing protein [Hymenobacter ruber]
MPFSLTHFLRDRFTLTADMAEPDEIRTDVEAGIKFRGTNLWVLMFAILIASVGLNVNSTAVIIGAMLISPLMGPIVGIGFGAATMEVPLMRRGLKNLLLAASISLAASTLYFYLTPLTDAGSELLARTTPTTWDVLIALFGGAAGAVGLTRRGRGNVIPGVAIATALMPPLCTAGYGLASGHWAYFGGALYLFSINCVFICLATFLVVQLLPLPRHMFVDEATTRRVRYFIWGVALLTAAPSVYLAVGIVRDTAFNHNAQQFIEQELIRLPGTYVLTRHIRPEERSLNLLLAGKYLDRAAVAALTRKLPQYGLRRAILTIRQGMTQLDSATAQALRTNVLEDMRNRDQQAYTEYEARFAQLQQQMANQQTAPALPAATQVLREAQINFPQVRQLGLSQLVRPATDSLRADTAVVVAVRYQQVLKPAEQQRFNKWLQARLGPRPVLVAK